MRYVWFVVELVGSVVAELEMFGMGSFTRARVTGQQRGFYNED